MMIDPEYILEISILRNSKSKDICIIAVRYMSKCLVIL